MSSPASLGARTIVTRVVVRSREVGIAMMFEITSMISMMIVFPITARNLGPDRYGEYTTLYVLAGFGMVWVYSGAGAAVMQLIMQVERSSGSLIRLGRRQVMATGALAAVIGLVVAAWLFGPQILLPALLVFGSELILVGFTQLNISAVHAVDGLKSATKINIVRPLLRTLGVVLLALGGMISLLNLVIVNIAASVVTLAVSMWLVRRCLGANPLSPSTHRELARYSAYYSTSMSTNTVQQEGDKIVLAGARPAAELGEYMAAYRIVATLALPFQAVMTAATRWFLPKDQRIGGQVGRAARLSVPTAMYGLVCAAAILIFSEAIRWVVGPEFELAVQITAWLCLVPLLQGLTELPFMGLMGLGRNRERMLLGVGTSAVAVASYLVLIPPMGWQGAVIGTYITDVTTLIAGWTLLLRYQKQANSDLAEQPANPG